MATAVNLLRPYPREELLWASPRERLDVLQADAIGCHIITVTPDILQTVTLVGQDLSASLLEAVRMLHRDSRQAGYSLRPFR